MPRLLLVSGSTRDRSTNTAALRTAALAAPDGVEVVLWPGLADVPAFVPDTDGGPALDELRAAITAADAVLFCTPEYAGTLPGSLKNVLDWLVGSGELYGKPVAWTNVANPGRGTGAEATLASVLGYVGAAIVESACRRIPVDRAVVGEDGLVADAGVRAALGAQVADLVAATTAVEVAEGA
ncbi:MAG: NADPH-dependent FMN reductase [Pseudonocardia sp.]